MRRSPRRGAARRYADRGAAAVEFAIVVIPLLWIVFGIISFGFMLTFRQTLSQAAAEGARAAAVEVDPALRESSAEDAVDAAMDAVGRSCGAGGLTCDVGTAQCGDADCVTVTLTYAYRDNPMVPTPPLIGEVIPETLEYSATVRVS